MSSDVPSGRSATRSEACRTSGAVTDAPYPSLAARRVDDQVHPTLADGVLVASADTHRHADDPELWIAEAKGNRAQGALGAAFHVAVPAHHVVGVLANPDRRSARAVDPRLEDV